MRSVESFFEPLSHFFPLFEESYTFSFGLYRKHGDLIQELSGWPTARANLICAFSANHFGKITQGRDDVVIQPFNNQTIDFFLKGTDDRWRRSRFKKTDNNGQSSNVKTKRQEEYFKQTCLFGEGHKESITASPVHCSSVSFTIGYIPEATGIDFESIILSKEDTKGFIYELDTRPSTIMTPLATKEHEGTKIVISEDLKKERWNINEQQEGGTKF